MKKRKAIIPLNVSWYEKEWEVLDKIYRFAHREGLSKQEAYKEIIRRFFEVEDLYKK